MATPRSAGRTRSVLTAFAAGYADKGARFRLSEASLFPAAAYRAAASDVTMSPFVLSIIASSSPRSRSGTLNFASVW